MTSDEKISRILASYNVSPSALQCAQIRAYISLLLKWNRSISLTSLIDEDEILKFHFGESVFALSAIKGIIGRLADVGSGAGFPGLPMRMFEPAIQLTLIESNAKKSVFLHEIVRELSLENIEVIRSRFQEVAAPPHAKFDFVVSRALGLYRNLLDWSASVLAPGGKVILWVGKDDADDIMRDSKWEWSPPIAIPASRRRYILSGSPPRDAG